MVSLIALSSDPLVGIFALSILLLPFLIIGATILVGIKLFQAAT